jgi:hypothetical protein
MLRLRELRVRAARQRGLLGTAVAGHVVARFREEPTIPKRETQTALGAKPTPGR